jgi:hypothetical protein
LILQNVAKKVTLQEKISCGPPRQKNSNNKGAKRKVLLIYVVFFFASPRKYAYKTMKFRNEDFKIRKLKFRLQKCTF